MCQKLILHTSQKNDMAKTTFHMVNGMTPLVKRTCVAVASNRAFLLVIEPDVQIQMSRSS